MEKKEAASLYIYIYRCVDCKVFLCAYNIGIWCITVLGVLQIIGLMGLSDHSNIEVSNVASDTIKRPRGSATFGVKLMGFRSDWQYICCWEHLNFLFKDVSIKIIGLYIRVGCSIAKVSGASWILPHHKLLYLLFFQVLTVSHFKLTTNATKRQLQAAVEWWNLKNQLLRYLWLWLPRACARK